MMKYVIYIGSNDEDPDDKKPVTLIRVNNEEGFETIKEALEAAGAPKEDHEELTSILTAHGLIGR